MFIVFLSAYVQQCLSYFYIFILDLLIFQLFLIFLLCCMSYPFLSVLLKFIDIYYAVCYTLHKEPIGLCIFMFTKRYAVIGNIF